MDARSDSSGDCGNKLWPYTASAWMRSSGMGCVRLAMISLGWGVYRESAWMRVAIRSAYSIIEPGMHEAALSESPKINFWPHAAGTWIYKATAPSQKTDYRLVEEQWNSRFFL